MAPKNPIHDPIDDEDIDDETEEVDPEWFPVPAGLQEAWDELKDTE